MEGQRVTLAWLIQNRIMKLHFERTQKPYVFALSNPSGVKTIIDSSTSLGGQDQGLTPMQLLAGSLAGCMSIDVLLILKKQKIEPAVFKIDMECDRHQKGNANPFRKIHLSFLVSNDVPIEKLERAIHLSQEKYCSVSMSLHEDIVITSAVHYI